MTAAQAAYGTPAHAATEALNESVYAYEGYANGSSEDVAAAIIVGLRERGFIVTNEPRCECGWTGMSNHMHDMRMGRAKPPETP